MAWRIHDSVVRGEIDNRVKGTVTGKLWLKGLKKPVQLELQGNACPDLAGCLLKFKNLAKTFSIRQKPAFNPLQRGRVGNLTASQKVRVFTIPEEEAFAMLDRGENPPERTANALYLEWFSEGDGRVVIESTDFELEISAPEWRLTAAEEKQRQRDVEGGWESFSKQLNDAIEKQERGQKDPEEKWDEHDYEKFLKESDARTDKYGELLDKYGHSEEAHEKIEKEMGWARELTPEEAEQQEQWINEMNAAAEAALHEPDPEPDPAREGIDWIRNKHGDLVHPLQHRCSESAVKFWKKTDRLGLKESNDKDLGDFIGEWLTTGAKLAGALNSIAQDRCPPEPAFTVAYLKRALNHLHKSQAGLERLSKRKKKLLPDKLVVAARKELFAIREGILKLMDDLRGRGQ
ncbi:MAG TPA: hypothetical protein VFZ59_02245 [Verrucomicrobiae bacterium]|nr:hypothetical protein [Verrucomicrobiae bacterium]